MVLGLVLPPLFLLNYVVNKGLRNCNFTLGCLNDVYNSKINADVIICGASRAKFQYSPKILDSILGINSYNIGVSGTHFHMQYAMFSLYMQHNKKPKYIIQNIDAGLLESQSEFFEADQYMPYAHDTIVQKFTHHLKGAFSFGELYFPLFIYNNHFDYIRQGFSTYLYHRVEPAKTYKGYIPHLEQWDGSFDAFKNANPNGVDFNYNDTVRREFVSYLNFCRDSGIQVIFVFAPVYHPESEMIRNRTAMDQFYKGYAKEYHIPYLDYTEDSICYVRSYFMNSQHLNVQGCELFCRKLGNDLKQYIQP